jgi:hypothetical protein
MKRIQLVALLLPTVAALAGCGSRTEHRTVVVQPPPGQTVVIPPGGNYYYYSRYDRPAEYDLTRDCPREFGC